MADARFVSHVSTLSQGGSEDRVIAVVLDAVERELVPLAATFFRVGDDGEVESVVAHGSQLAAAQLVAAVRGWELELGGIDPLTPRRLSALPGRVLTLEDLGPRSVLPRNGRLREVFARIGVINDVRMTIREGGHAVAGVALWRPYGSRAWSGSELRRLEALQPLAEAAYVDSRRSVVEGDRLPATLTPRQREVALLLAAGASNDEVARSLRVSPDTAKTHTRAVLSKLRMRSRKEVASHLGRSAASTAPRSAEDASRRVLALVLDWAAERLGAVAGGSALVSPRPEIVADAWGIAPPGSGRVDRQLVQRLHERLVGLLSPPKAIERRAVEQGVLTGLAALAGWRGDAPGPELLEELGVEAPILIALPLRGRLAGLTWLVHPRDARGNAVVAVRRLHPLLELACREPLRAALAPRPHEGFGSYGLTPRETTVAALAIGGASNEEIAERLGVSVSTVKNHMTRVMAKCGVRSRTQLIAFARDLTPRS